MSRAPTKPQRHTERVLTVALVDALKQFRHYLLGRPFKILNDYAPLQWISAQKMEGLLARWALAIRVRYTFPKRT